MSTRAMSLARMVARLNTDGQVPSSAIFGGIPVNSVLAGTVSNSTNLSSVSPAPVRGNIYYVQNTGQGFYFYDGADFNKITTT